MVNAFGFQANQEKVEPILTKPPPTKIRQLRQFLDMNGWHMRFLGTLSDDEIPLVYLIKKGVSLHSIGKNNRNVH